MKSRFAAAMSTITTWLGSSTALILSFVMVAVWALAGPLFGWSDTHQLIINTTTTIITFWMIFVVQNTQNRDSKAIHVKLDELLQILDDDSERFIDLEDATVEEIQEALDYVKSRPTSDVRKL